MKAILRVTLLFAMALNKPKRNTMTKQPCYRTVACSFTWPRVIKIFSSRPWKLTCALTFGVHKTFPLFRFGHASLICFKRGSFAKKKTGISWPKQTSFLILRKRNDSYSLLMPFWKDPGSYQKEPSWRSIFVPRMEMPSSITRSIPLSRMTKLPSLRPIYKSLPDMDSEKEPIHGHSYSPISLRPFLLDDSISMWNPPFVPLSKHSTIPLNSSPWSIPLRQPVSNSPDSMMPWIYSSKIPSSMIHSSWNLPKNTICASIPAKMSRRAFEDSMAAVPLPFVKPFPSNSFYSMMKPSRSIKYKPNSTNTRTGSPTSSTPTFPAVFKNTMLDSRASKHDLPSRYTIFRFGPSSMKINKRFLLKNCKPLQPWLFHKSMRKS